jgi:hypothetical protein
VSNTKSPATPGFFVIRPMPGKGNDMTGFQTTHRKVIALATLPLAWAMAAHAGEANTASPSQEDIEREMCEHTVCQRNLHVVLKQKDGKTYDQTFAVFPGVVQEMGITVVAGQTVHVEADVAGDRLVKLKAVDAIAHPDKTITATLTQDQNGGTMLSLTNPFARPLKFDMGMMPLDADSLFKTSSCPVIAGGGSFEMWPYPIFQLVLANARLLDAGAPMACTE